MIELEKKKERVILAAVSTGDEKETVMSLAELAELAKTAGAEVAGSLMQNRESVHPGTYLGSGKMEELKEMMQLLEADAVICDDELSPAQLNNLQDKLSCKVVDRTLLILDIFAARARTGEGKIQVELAQLKYRASRLTGLGRSLSRQGGGIGTRGPGEKKLETDRRLIGERIGVLKKELEEVKKHRDTLRDGRKRGNLSTAAIVGYTNAGKSTLLNALTDARVLEEDALFATLDPTTRAAELPLKGKILLTDTVGFIRKLPHHLVEAFKSTLEEAVYADIIIHVVDASNPEMDRQMQVVYETLDMLGVKNKPVITCFNKTDRDLGDVILYDSRATETVSISAKTGAGLPELLAVLEKQLLAAKLYIDRVYPYDKAGKIAVIREKGQLLSEEYEAGGIHVTAYVPMEIYGAIDI